MDEFKHLFPRDTASTEKYIYAGPRGGGEFALPPRDDRVAHGAKLVTEIQAALSSREQAHVISLLVSRVEFDVSDSTVAISFYPTAIKVLADASEEHAA